MVFLALLYIFASVHFYHLLCGLYHYGLFLWLEGEKFGVCQFFLISCKNKCFLLPGLKTCLYECMSCFLWFMLFCVFVCICFVICYVVYTVLFCVVCLNKIKLNYKLN